VHYETPVPFGQDRLIPIWIATLALRQKSRTVRFESAAQILDFFRLSPDGYHYRRIVQGFQRIFAATIFFGSEDQPGNNAFVDWARFHFFDDMHLWFSPGRESASDNPANTITLSEAFYREIDEHRIPVEREVVAALAHAPGILDFYLWVVWKSWTVNGVQARIAIVGNGGLNQQLGSKEYSLDRRFRHTVVTWLRKVKAFWPECPATISDDRRLLIISSSRNSPAIQSARPPGTNSPRLPAQAHDRGAPAERTFTQDRPLSNCPVVLAQAARPSTATLGD